MAESRRTGPSIDGLDPNEDQSQNIAAPSLKEKANVAYSAAKKRGRELKKSSEQLLIKATRSGSKSLPTETTVPAETPIEPAIPMETDDPKEVAESELASKRRKSLVEHLTQGVLSGSVDIPAEAFPTSVTEQEPGVAFAAAKLQALEAQISALDGVSWADLVETSLAQKAAETLQVSEAMELTSLLRSGSLISGENRVILPTNFRINWPWAFDKIEYAVTLSGCRIIYGENVPFTILYKKFFGATKSERIEMLPNLDSKNIEALATTTALLEGLTHMPSIEAAGLKGRGAMGTQYLALMIAGIYCEQLYNTPLRLQSKWWRNTADMRTLIIKHLTTTLQSEVVAKQLLTVIEIIYRKLVRSIVANPNTRPRIDELAQHQVTKLICSGRNLIQKCFRSSVKETIVKKIIPGARAGKDRTVDEKKTNVLFYRPSVNRGAMSVRENSWAKKINASMSKMELSLGIDFNFNTFPYGPGQWEDMLQRQINIAYSKIGRLNDLLGRRKKMVRNKIFDNHRIAFEKTQTGNAKFTMGKISPAEWDECSRRFETENSERWTEEFYECLQTITVRPMTYSDWDQIPEDDLLEVLGIVINE